MGNLHAGDRPPAVFNVDTAAHIGGLIGGFALGWLMDAPRATARHVETFWRAAASVCVALTVLSFALMLRQLFA